MSMRNVNHTDPNSTENTFGRLFRRGPEATDGGESPADTADEERASEPMRDVSHEPDDGPDANGVWERGRDETEE